MAKKNNAPIAVEVRNNVVIIWLDRPEAYNALDARMVGDLLQALEEVASEPGLRALILGGRGEAFCSGGDVAWMRDMGRAAARTNEQSAHELARLFHALYTCPIPTIARIHGACFAGGVGLAAACDIAVATSDAEFGCAETKRGLVPAGIGPYLVRAMGQRMAQRYLLSGERFEASEAFRTGLVQEICPPEELDGTINALLGHLVAGAPEALRRTKALLHELPDVPIDETLVKLSALRIAETRASDEAQEGMSAFLEKRDPAWIGGAQAAKKKRAKR